MDYMDQMDTRGLGIVLLDYLTTVEWTSFELLSEALRLHPVVLSRAMRFLEAVSERGVSGGEPGKC